MLSEAWGGAFNVSLALLTEAWLMNVSATTTAGLYGIAECPECPFLHIFGILQPIGKYATGKDCSAFRAENVRIFFVRPMAIFRLYAPHFLRRRAMILQALPLYRGAHDEGDINGEENVQNVRFLIFPGIARR